MTGLNRREFLAMPALAAVPPAEPDLHIGEIGTDCAFCHQWIPGDWHPDFDFCPDCIAAMPEGQWREYLEG